jgi:mycothiol system anti-sigma-R factor
MHEDCMKHIEHISEFLDGELDEATCEEIRAHLRECPACRECVESLKKTVDVLKRCPDESVPGDVHDRLKAALRRCVAQRTGDSA